MTRLSSRAGEAADLWRGPPHFCLGANLARAEQQEAFTFLSPRMPDLELDGEPVYDNPLGIYGLNGLAVRWRA